MTGVMAALALWIAISVHAPRFMAYGPALTGLAAWIAVRYRCGIWLPVPRLYLALAAGIPALALVSALWALDPAFAAEEALKLALVLLPGMFLFSVLRAAPADLVSSRAWWLLAGLGAALLFLIVELSFDMPLYRLTHGLPEDHHLDRFQMNRGTVIVTLAAIACLPLLLPLTRQVPGGARVTLHLAAVLLALLLAVHAATESQSANLALGLALAAMVLFPVHWNKAFGILSAGIAMLLTSAPWLSGYLYDKLAALTRDNEWLRDAYAAQRMEIWSFISEYALRKPWTGFGIEATRYIRDFEIPGVWFHNTEILHPHNFALQIWIEFGGIGILLSIVFFALLVRGIAQIGDTPEKGARLSARIALGLFIACLSVAATGYGLWQGWWIGAFCLAAALWCVTDKALRAFYHS